MIKFFNISYKIMIGILIVLFSYITIVSAFYGIGENISPLIVILGTIVTFFLFKWLNTKSKELKK